MLKTLGLVVTNRVQDAPALAAAAALARREGAHLGVICLGVEPVPIEAIAMEAPPIALDWSAAEAQKQAEALAGWARTTIPDDLPASVRPMTAPSLNLATVAGRVMRLCDLVVMARPYGPGAGKLAPMLAEGVLFGAGVPVLAVPDADPTDWSRPFRRVCLAWNESDEALRATRGALPFLQAAEAVDVAVVDPPLHAHGRAEPAEDLCLWLARHGVRSEIALLPRTEPRVSDILTRFCQERGCEALVMGAYGHSRLREALLGGATRDLLASVPLPLILAH